MSGKKDKGGAGARLSEALALPADTFGDWPCIRVRGNREVVVEGCEALVDYNVGSVRMRTRTSGICMKGRGLSLKYLSVGVLSVRGLIEGIEFEK